MPSGGNFTNFPSRSMPVVPAVSTRSTRSAPHTARGYAHGIMPLTPRERQARQVQRLQHNQRTAGVDGFAVDPISGRNTVLSGTSSFFSPQLSTDFLELPQ